MTRADIEAAVWPTVQRIQLRLMKRAMSAVERDAVPGERYHRHAVRAREQYEAVADLGRQTCRILEAREEGTEAGEHHDLWEELVEAAVALGVQQADLRDLGQLLVVPDDEPQPNLPGK